MGIGTKEQIIFSCLRVIYNELSSDQEVIYNIVIEYKPKYSIYVAKITERFDIYGIKEDEMTDQEKEMLKDFQNIIEEQL